MAVIKRLYGFTLFELLLSLSIVAILSIMAFAAFRLSFCHIKTLLVIRQITGELSLARSIAVMTQQKTIYGSNNSQGNWDKGRIITQNGKIIHRFDSLPGNYHLTLRNSLYQNTGVTFTPLGFTAWQLGSFYLTAPLQQVQIIITLSGKIRVVTEN
jgi:prepilin-type N-terminal cleavage/methylation domain-containing protein